MLKTSIFGTVLLLALVIAVPQNCFAQEKTADELKAEREVLKTEMKSEKAAERQTKFENLKPPKPSGIATVDDLATSSTAMLKSTKKNNEIIPDLYKRTIGETTDGVTDVTVKKPSLVELTTLSANIAKQIKAVSESSTAIKNASADIKKASPMKAPKGTKSLNYSKEVISLVGPELDLQQKVVTHLITTLKSSKNY